MSSKNTIIKVIFIVALLGVFVFFGTRGPLGSVRKSVVGTVQFFLKLTTGVNHTIDGIFSNTEEIEALFQEARFETAVLRQENERLRDMLLFKNTGSASLLGARVLSYFNEFGKEFLFIDQGRDAGVNKGDLVLIDAYTVVGVIYKVGDDFSHVAIASNSDRSFEVELIPSGVRALAKGIGGRAFALELLPIDAEIRGGDFVSVSYTAGGVRRTLLLAVIAGEEIDQGGAFKSARASFLARPEVLNNVFVVPQPR